VRAVVLAVLVSLACAASAAAEPYVVVYKPTVPSVDAKTDQLQTAYAFVSRHRWSTAVRGFSADLSSSQRDRVALDGRELLEPRQQHLHRPNCSRNRKSFS